MQFAHFDYGTWEHCFKHLVSIIKSRFLEGHYFTMRPSLFESSGCVVFFQEVSSSMCKGKTRISFRVDRRTGHNWMTSDYNLLP